MTIYVESNNDKSQKVYADGSRELPKEEWENLKGKEIKNIKKLDGKIIFTLK